MKILTSVLISLAFSAMAATALADEGRVYTDGPVVEVSYIRTKPGKFDEYMKFLATTYRTLMEANKKAGLIQDYGIYSATPRSPQDPDLFLTTTYANMAALDRSEEAEALSVKTLGSMASQTQAAIDREALREVLGSELIRKLNLK
jgi:L-rhamnose mutarotase